MKPSEKKFVQLYTGNGKGKTTAAIGLAVRAAGHGMKTYIGQFMKGQIYGELTALRNHPFITIEQYGDTKCIRKEDVTQKHMDQARQGLFKAQDAMLSGKYDILVLDEINVAVWFGLISVDDVIDFLSKRPDNLEVILTGRNAPAALIAAADLVTEMKEVKHYYTQGILARDGIER
ncbi:MAG: cob(I)yrinic acid a,c-diamide adenosyltransferase [Desulfobacteraceae bacterium]|nr:cob(I)yrinic acid a,c-diamide adenosyltransferase [Desulfobacteraceae bacterium]MBC2756565.1 cob(I)yrinic acid a,c-diamide adenosyltransferase [Desulfobacteraceae bacterium]